MSWQLHYHVTKFQNKWIFLLFHTMVTSVEVKSAYFLSVRNKQETALNKKVSIPSLWDACRVTIFHKQINSISTSCHLLFCLRNQWTAEFVGCCLSQHLEQFTGFWTGGKNHSRISKNPSFWLHRRVIISHRVQYFSLDFKF